MSLATRISSLNPGCPWRLLPAVTGTIDHAERQAIAYLYTGILSDTTGGGGGGFTTNARSSEMNLLCPWRLPSAPTGTVSQGERQVILYLYSGILAGGHHTPSPDTGTGGRLIDRPYWIGRHKTLSGIYKIPPP